MLFKDSIPEEVLFNPNVSAFVSILDELQKSKQGVISSALRSTNPLLCNDKKWLIRYLEDFGLSGVPIEIPLVCLQQLALNMDEIFSRIGTEVGVVLFLETVTLGVAIINVSGAQQFQYLLPDSILDGFITNDNVTSNRRYLVDRNTLNGTCQITINLSSKIFVSDISTGSEAMATFKEFIKSSIKKFVRLQPDCTITVNTSTRSSYVYPKLLNDYFKNT